MIRAQVTDGARLAARLRRLERKVSMAAAAAVAATAREVREAARSGVPRRSGRLAASITIESTPDGLAATVGSDLDVATYLELGTRRMPARPWLLPAFRAVAPRLRERLAMNVGGQR